MSRIAKAPIVLPAGVDVKLDGNNVTVKGSKGQMSFELRTGVGLEFNENVIQVKWDESVKNANAHAGTVRATVTNMVTGVSSGFERKLTLVGVGYRAQVAGNVLNLSLGYSHPVGYEIPEGINIETPTQTEIIVKGIDKQKVGQVAAKIRAYRAPEPYKGKGVRYANENVVIKEAKKK
jgi:large subunit ribosomal protein L6